MRKVTQNAVNALMNASPMSCNWSESNTKVSSANGDAYLYLFGNIIAIRNFKTGKIKISNGGWFSNTTKERLNGLPNVHIQVKQGVWYLNGKVWDGKLIDIN